MNEYPILSIHYITEEHLSYFAEEINAKLLQAQAENFGETLTGQGFQGSRLTIDVNQYG